MRRQSDHMISLRVAHQWHVMPHCFHRVLPLPANATEVPEAHRVTTEVGSLLHRAFRAHGILKIRIDLYLLCKSRCFYLDKSRRDRLHVRVLCVKCNASGSYWILVFVSINTCINNSAEQIVHNFCQTTSSQHAVKCADEYCFMRVKLLRCGFHIVTVFEGPRYHLYLLCLHSF